MAALKRSLAQEGSDAQQDQSGKPPATAASAIYYCRYQARAGRSSGRERGIALLTVGARRDWLMTAFSTWQYQNRAAPLAKIERLRRLAWLIDAAGRVPGTRFRFGLNSVIGLAPGAGNAVLTLICEWPDERRLQYERANTALISSVGVSEPR
jgi:hypothetical protein